MMGLWYSILGILVLLAFVIVGAGGMSLYALFTIFIPMPPFFSSSSVLSTGVEMGKRSGSIPYPDGLGQQKSLPG